MYRKPVCQVFLLVSFLAVMLTPVQAEIAVRKSGHVLAGANQVAAASFEITNDGEAGNYLIVAAASETSIIKTMTFGGVTMPELLGVNTAKGASGYVQFFGLATTEKAGKVDMTYSGNIFGTQIYGYAFLSGIDLASPVRATGSGIQDPGKGTLAVAYSAPVQAGDFAFLMSNKNNKPTPAPSVSPSDNVLFAGNAGASFSGMVAYDADLAAGDAYVSTFTFAATDREVAGGVILANAGGPGGSARGPSPADRATGIDRKAVLTWVAGPFVPAAKGHDVYFGGTFEDVNNATVAAHPNVVYMNVDVNSFEPGVLEYGKMYYWRVDEVNAPPDSTVFKGAVWSFTVDPYAYPIKNVTATASSSDQDAGPQNTVNSSGLNADNKHSADKKAMWISAGDGSQPTWIRYAFDKVYKLHEMSVWNYNVAFENILGFGIKEVAVEYSQDDASWTTLGEFQLAQGLGQDGYAANTTVSFGGVAARYVRLTARSNFNGSLPQYGLSEVRFFHVPVQAMDPQPASGQTGVDPAAVLSWRPGREAVRHEIYLSGDRSAVAGSTALIDTVEATSFELSAQDLQLGATYYWRVVEVNEAETPAAWPGDVWQFTTPAYLAVDDFESYDDLENTGTRIYETWIDGWDDPKNGSQVGYAQAPFAEQKTIHGGRQSMPLLYDNTSAPLSEAVCTFDEPQDWTKAGIQTLVLYFSGATANTGGQLYVKINSTKIPFAGSADAIKWPWWTQWNISLASVGGNLKAVRSVTIGVEGAGAAGTIYVDDLRLYKAAPAGAGEELWIEAESGVVTEPMSVFDALPDASGGKYVGAAIGNNSTDAPPATGIVKYSLTVKGGVYRILCRVIAPTSSDDSLWVRVPGATMNTKIHVSGWVNWNGIATGAEWHWDDVHSGDDNNKIVQFTLPAGTHTLEIAYREDGALIDAILITDKLN